MTADKPKSDNSLFDKVAEVSMCPLLRLFAGAVPYCQFY